VRFKNLDELIYFVAHRVFLLSDSVCYHKVTK
jgi:hypothetical protein